MRILMCSPQELTERLGISRVQIALAKELQAMGHSVELAGPRETGDDLPTYLRARAAGFDAVEVDHEQFPYGRNILPPRVLLVARTVLLVQHLAEIDMPEGGSLRNRLGRLLKGRARAAETADRIRRADLAFAAADLANLPNEHDRALLMRKGIPERKLAVIPYGLSPERLAALGAAPAEPPSAADPVIAFVGTFDYRKGATHLPRILEAVDREIPRVRLRLVGCRGLFQTEAQVLSFFPRRLRGRVEARMAFESGELGPLLSDCSLGVFPSYMEGFPFGVLEMLAARLPVAAFDAPGAPMMLRSLGTLAPIGDDAGIARLLVGFLKNDARLFAARAAARRAAERFTWRAAAERTVEEYQAALGRL